MADSTDLARDTLLALCAGGLDAGDSETLMALSPADWQWIGHRAKAYRLLPLLNSMLAPHADWPVPPSLRKTAHSAHQHWVFRSLVMQQALVRIGELLDRHTIPYCALKGASLSLEFYAEPALRPMRDLDIMVSPQDAERAYALLLKSGFTRVPGKGDYGIDYAHHLPPLVNEDRVILELHHRIAPRDWSGSLALGERLMANARPIEFQGNTLQMAHPTDTLLHLVVHAAFQHLFDNGPNLLSDIVALEAGGQVDWSMAESFAQQHGLLPSLELSRAIVAHYRAGHPPTPQPRHAPQSMLDQAATLMTQDPEQHWQRFLLRKRRSLGQRLVEGVARALRPSARDLSEIAQKDVKGLAAVRYYPAWLFERARVYLGAEFKPELNREAAGDAELERWLGRPKSSHPEV